MVLLNMCLKDIEAQINILWKLLKYLGKSIDTLQSSVLKFILSLLKIIFLKREEAHWKVNKENKETKKLKKGKSQLRQV